VVELDDSGAIMSKADRLYNILLMNASASASSLRTGLPLQNFLFAHSDKQLFEDLMGQALASQNAEVRHMDMRDSMGHKVRMEVFLLAFTKDGSGRYLMGIKERCQYRSSDVTQFST